MTIAPSDHRGKKGLSAYFTGLTENLCRWAGFHDRAMVHVNNGIRHLAWDCGLGFERKQARASGWAVFIAAVALTAFCAIWIVRMRGGGFS